MVCNIVQEIEHETEFPDKIVKVELALTHLISAIETPLEVRNAVNEVKNTVIEHIDESQEAILRSQETILKAIDAKSDNDQELIDLIKVMDAYVQDLQKLKIEEYQKKDDIDKAARIIKDPELEAKLKVKSSIPLIPSLLSLEGEVGLSSGINFRNAWNRLTGKHR